jgi:hypothetical protein
MGRVAWAVADPPAPAPDLDRAVGSGFAFLQKQQAGDGSFDREAATGVEVCARSLLAFQGAGHVPDVGKYGLPVRNAVDWLLAQQGSKGYFGAEGGSIRGHVWATMALAQAYGVESDPDQRVNVFSALARATGVIAAAQIAANAGTKSEGGWTLDRTAVATEQSAANGDLTMTALCLLAYRACSAVGVAIAPTSTRRAVDFAMRCFDAGRGFATEPGKRGDVRGSAAGIICMYATDSTATNSDKVDSAGKLITARPNPAEGGQARGVDNRTNMSGFQVLLAALRIGGDVWESVGPPALAGILKAQGKDGGWAQRTPPAAGRPKVSRTSATASALQLLTMPYSLLPMYQH